MTKKDLDVTDVRSSGQHVSGATVTKPVEGDVLGDSGLLCVPLERQEQRGRP